MHTLILLLAFADPGLETLPESDLTPEQQAKVTAREKANQEKFKVDLARREAAEAHLAACRGEMKRENEERIAKQKADRLGALLVSSPKAREQYIKSLSPEERKKFLWNQQQRLTVQQRAKILYDKHHPKK